MTSPKGEQKAYTTAADFQARHTIPAVIRRTLSFAGVVGLGCGLLDAAAIQLNFLASRGGIDYAPARLWLVAPLAWIAWCVFPAALAAIILPRRSGLIVPLIVVAGPGLLLLVRLIAPIRFPWPDLGYAVPIISWVILAGLLAWLAYAQRKRLLAAFGPRAATPVVGAAVVIALLGLIARHLFDSVSTAAASSLEERPNIVLVFLDTVRYDVAGLQPGRSSQAPFLAEFAASGLVFDHAYAPFPWTLSSHIAVITGEGAETLTVTYDQQVYRGRRRTLAELLRGRGYATAAVVANGFLNPGSGFARGVERFEQCQSELDLCRTSIGFLIRNVGPYLGVRPCVWDGEEVTGRAKRLIARLSRPYFLMLNYMDTHIPYNISRDCRDETFEPFYPLAELPPLERVNRLGIALPSANRERLERKYAVAMRCLDRSLGELFHGLDDNTIVAVVSDHGEQFGEHNLVLHGNSVYAQNLRVPLVLRGPGIRAGRIGQPVSITDLYGTLLALGGAESDSPILPSSAAEVAPPVIGVHKPARRILPAPPRTGVTAWSVVEGGFHLIRHADGREELYDYRRDPHETRNLAGQSRFESIRAELLGPIREHVRQAEREHEQRKQFYSLGYVH